MVEKFSGMLWMKRDRSYEVKSTDTRGRTFLTWFDTSKQDIFELTFKVDFEGRGCSAHARVD